MAEVIAVPPEATVTEGMVCAKLTPLPIPLSPAEQEELAQDNGARHDWIAEEGRQQREVHGLYQRTADFKVSTTDPDATPMRLKGGGTHLGYHMHYVVDGGKARIILQVLVTPSEVMDNQPMRDLIFRTRFRWKLHPRHVTGDTKYGTIENIKALEDAGIRAYVPLPDWEHMTPFFGPSKFSYDAALVRFIQSTRPRRWSIAPMRPPVMLVCSRRSVPQAITVGNCTVPSMPPTWSESRATIRPKPTRKL